MFKHLSTLTKASLYFGLALGMATGLAYLVVKVPSMGQSIGESDIYMLTPIVAVLLMLLVVTRDGYHKGGWQVLGLHRLGLRSWPWAVLVPVSLLTLSYALTWTFGIGRLDLSLAPSVGQMLLLLVMQIVFSLTEEIGWRGYLLPHLLPLGRSRAMLVSGLCHGLWHLPVMLMTPFYHEDGNRVVVVTLFLMTLTAAGVFYGYFRLMSNSLWPAVLTHAFVNGTWAFWRTVTVAVISVESLEYWAGETGIFSLVLICLVAGWLLYRTHRQGQAAQVELPVVETPVVAHQ